MRKRQKCPSRSSLMWCMKRVSLEVDSGHRSCFTSSGHMVFLLLCPFDQKVDNPVVALSFLVQRKTPFSLRLCLHTFISIPHFLRPSPAIKCTVNRPKVGAAVIWLIVIFSGDGLGTRGLASDQRSGVYRVTACERTFTSFCL